MALVLLYFVVPFVEVAGWIQIQIAEPSSLFPGISLCHAHVEFASLLLSSFPYTARERTVARKRVKR